MSSVSQVPGLAFQLRTSIVKIMKVCKFREWSILLWRLKLIVFAFRSHHLHNCSFRNCCLCHCLFDGSNLREKLGRVLPVLADVSFFNYCKNTSFKLKFLFNISYCQLFIYLPSSYNCQYDKPGIVGRTKRFLKVNTIFLQPNFL